MTIGITNTTTITMDNITYIANSTTPAHFLVNVNEIAFNGIGFFLILCTMLIILFIILQKNGESNGSVLHNAMYSFASITIASFFVRAVEVYVHGVKRGLLTDKLMWLFPLITMAIAWVLWMTKE